MPPVLETLSAHRSIRKFSGRPVEPDRNALAAYDRVIQNYYEKRSPKLKERTWTRQMADSTSQVIRPHMRHFLEKKGFFRQ